MVRAFSTGCFSVWIIRKPSSPAPNGSKPTKVGLVGSDPHISPSHLTPSNHGFSGPVRSRFESSFSGPLQKKTTKIPGKSQVVRRNSTKFSTQNGRKVGEIFRCRLSHVKSQMDYDGFFENQPKNSIPQKYSPKHRCLGFFDVSLKCGMFQNR